VGFVAYYRVSTHKQSLGLDAQRAAVARYLGDVTPLAAFGRRGARLVVAKLDRLSRDVHFIAGLQKAGVSFVCADMPELDEFTCHIFAALAQRERKMIATRTREGLAALKARGVTKTGKPVRLGNPLNGSPSQQAAAAAGIRRKADTYAAGVMVEIEKLQRTASRALRRWPRECALKEERDGEEGRGWPQCSHFDAGGVPEWLRPTSKWQTPSRAGKPLAL